MVNERRRRVLVVDDEEMNRMLLRHALEPAGYTVTEAGSAAEARVRLESEGADIMLLDIGMPEVSGFDLMRQLRQSPDTINLPVIFVSAITDPKVVVEGFGLGAEDYVTKPIDFPVLLARIQTRLEATQRTSQLQEQAAVLSRLASLDPLTGLLNRRAFLETYNTEYQRAARYGRPLAVLMLDLDHFKAVNDQHGHAVGDEVIRRFAELSANRLRATDYLSRYGGEEFCAVLTETDLAGALATAELIRKTADETHFQVADRQVRVTVSIGAAHLAHGTRLGADSLIEAADLALYRAKDAGRNCVRGPGN